MAIARLKVLWPYGHSGHTRGVASAENSFVSIFFHTDTRQSRDEERDVTVDVINRQWLRHHWRHDSVRVML